MPTWVRFNDSTKRWQISTNNVDFTDLTENPLHELVDFNGTSAPSVSASNQGRLYYDSTADVIKASENGGSFKTLLHKLTTKGDLFTFDTDIQRLALGSNQQELSVLTSAATGLQWWDRPCCFAQLSADQTGVVAGSSTPLDFDSELWDTIGMHDNVTNKSRFTPNVAGLYLFFSYVRFSADGTGTYRSCSFIKNGDTSNRRRSNQVPPITGGVVQTGINGISIWNLNGSTDYVQAEGIHDATSNLSFVGGANFSYCFVIWLRGQTV